MKSLLLLSFLLTSSLNAFADSDVVTLFRQSAIRLLEQGKARGVESIDDIKLDDVIESAKTVKIVYTPQVSHVYGGRKCASWALASAQNPAYIRLNEECAKLSDLEMSGIAVHEILGVTKTADIKYEFTSELISQQKLISSDKITPLKNISKSNAAQRSSGGSTVVGGGGDYDDLLFKTSGLAYLKNYNDHDSVYGVPVYLLKIVIKKMKALPASDISTPFQLRRPGVEERAGNFDSPAALYIHSSIYRSRSEDVLGKACVQAARLALLFAPDDLDMAYLKKESYEKIWKSDLADQPYLSFQDGLGGTITWENDNLTAKLNDQQKDKALEQSVKRAASIENQSLYTFDVYSRNVLGLRVDFSFR